MTKTPDNMKTILRLFAAAFLMLTAAQALSAQDKGKEIYLDIMQQAVEAYTPEHIDQYIADIETRGITEHGFARLTSNMGVLIAHGRLQQYKDRFIHMMDLCTSEIPTCAQRNRKIGEIGNEFAVKEIVLCILEVEAAGIVPKEKTDAWRAALTDMKADDIYVAKPKPGDPTARNWCVFGSTSECARIMAGIGGDRSFADKYLGDQLRFFDENGMYMDPGQPSVYDLVTRLQYMLALYCGYDGPAKEGIIDNLRKSARLTLNLQSVTGEIPYGGRSNQFLHNETFLAAVCEYYASWMAKEGDMELASRFKAAAKRASASLAYWTSQTPLRHVKNRFPTETGYGCETYAHFNKYMVTAASWAYSAYLFADDSIKAADIAEEDGTFVTSDKFHRIIMNNGGYTVQFDTDAEKKYDSSGIGRFQKAGAPPVLALSSPCPTSKPNYKLDIQNPGPLAIAPLWDEYKIVKAEKGRVVLTNGKAVWTTKLSRRGMKIILKGDGEQLMTLPALIFDGETKPLVESSANSLAIHFNGWVCRYKTNGKISDTGIIHANRNGHLRRYDANRKGRLVIRGKISQES